MVQQSEFEKLIENNESALRRIRNTYFPLIAQRIITGYNLYPKLFDYSQGRLFLNYFHSDLKPEDSHFKELSEKLRESGFLEQRVVIDTRAINQEIIMPRNADYITKSDWKDPLNMRYFDFNGNEIQPEVARSSEISLIGETFQYDWLIKIKDEKELRRVIDLFKLYASKFSLDKQGRKIVENGKPKYNNSAISESWDTPLLVCTVSDKKKPKPLVDFLGINQFNVVETLDDVSVVLSTLVRSKTKELKRFLQRCSYVSKPIKKYAIRVFVEEYIDAK